MGKIYNTEKKHKLYLCRYCNRFIMKNGFRRHRWGKEHENNLKKYGDNPPIADSDIKKNSQKVRIHYKPLIAYMED